MLPATASRERRESEAVGVGSDRADLRSLVELRSPDLDERGWKSLMAAVLREVRRMLTFPEDGE